MKTNFFKYLIMTTFVVIFLLPQKLLGQEIYCENSEPFCTGTTIIVNSPTNTSAEPGPYYDCLMTQPNSMWYHLLIDNPGDLIIDISSVSGSYDVDFVCWGPFSSMDSVCNNLDLGLIVDCSYSTASVEECNIENALVGDYYILLVTNYSNSSNMVQIYQSGGDGTSTCDTTLCVVSAGSDDNVLGLTYDFLDGSNNPGDYDGYWFCSESGVVFSDITDNNSQVDVSDYGEYTFFWTITNANDSTCSSQVTILFDSIPTSTFEFDYNICFGDTVIFTYTGNAPLDAVYNWDFGPGTIVSGSGQGPYEVIFSPPGTYNISLFVTFEGFVSEITIMEIIAPEQMTATITSFDAVCSTGASGRVNLTIDNPYGSVSVEWSNVTGPPFEIGNYSVTITDSHGCFVVESFEISGPDPIILNLESTPEDPLGSFTGTASSTVSGGTPDYTYHWSNSQASQNISGLETGWYFLTVIDFNGCTATDSVFVDFTILASSITETPKYRIYPIPTKNNLYVDVLNSEICLIEICDVLGKKLFVKPLVQGIQVFNLSGMGRGLYFVYLHSERGFVLEKIVLE